MACDISIVIVNYNVRHFVKRCIESIYNSKVNGLTFDLHVVDNASIDGSNDMIRADFPDVKLIANIENVGFAVANNQAIKKINSKYILVLNPDTVVREDTLQVCFDYMESRNEVGALGVKMIDGTGRFLPESKRDLPTVWNSVSKLSGLASVFPTSKLFNGYALGHLDKDQRHKIKVLCGAFMFVRNSIIEKIGAFDERFFMYGEDIDWSRRIIEAGHEIHYIPDTAIIHYKGESTKKTSLNYVKTFYEAMGLYVEKHYTGSSGKWFARFLKLGIHLRALISGTKRLLSDLLWPVIDGLLIFISLYSFSKFWASSYFKDPSYYNNSGLEWSLVFYAFIWIIVLWFVGYYQKSIIRKRVIGIITGSILILSIYALLPDVYRSSRVIILTGTILAILISSLTTLLANRGNTFEKIKNILIVADFDTALMIQKSLDKAEVKSNILGIINPISGAPSHLQYLNNISQLGPLSKILKADEVIFSAENLSMKEIMRQMMSMDTKLSFKIAGDDSLSIIGSNSKNTTGELYNVNIKYNLADGYYRHMKRIFDITSSLLLIGLSPILLPFNGFKIVSYFRNVFSVFFGINTFVGYAGNIADFQNLPEINSGIIAHVPETSKDLHGENLYYARDYTVWIDVEIVAKTLNKIGR